MKKIFYLLLLLLIACHDVDPQGSQDLPGARPPVSDDADGATGDLSPDISEGEATDEWTYVERRTGVSSGRRRRRGEMSEAPIEPGTEATGSDRSLAESGRGESGLDLVPMEVSCPSGDFYKGMTFVCWSRNCFNVPESTDSLEALRGLGSNWIALVPTWYQETLTSSVIGEDPSRSPSQDEIRDLITRVRGLGFRTLLKPHIDIRRGGWRGSIEPADVASWRASYRDFMLTFARLAEEMEVESFSIGTELKRRSGDLSFWQDLISRIRALYSGSLTYSANWDEYEDVGFWQQLDFIGIDFYFPLTDDPEATVDEMVAALQPIRDDLQRFSEAEGKPFLFTEIGYRSINGTNTRPYDFRMRGDTDLQEQADAYEAALSVFQGEEWLRGIFWWRWDPRVTTGASDEGYLIYGKPAADILMDFWGGDECGEEAPVIDEDQPPSDSSNASFVTFGDWGDHGGDNQREVAQAITSYCGNHACDFIVTLGDNFYSPDGVESVTDAHWYESYRNVYRDGPDGVGLTMPFYPSLGNHDMGGDPEAQVAYSAIDPLWRMPAQDYSFCWPEGVRPCLAEFFLFNSNYDHFGDEEDPDTNGNGRNDYWDWMESAVSASEARWKFLAMHHPIINNGNHDDWDQGDQALEFLTGLICREGIDLVISGHAHSFSHLRGMVNGCPIEQLIVGTGGRGLNWSDDFADDPRIVSTTGDYFGFGWLQVTPNQVLFRFVRSDNGQVFYETTWERP